MTADIHETYGRAGRGPAMAKFLAFTSLRGPVPPDFRGRAVDPADLASRPRTTAAGTTRCWART